MKPSSVLLGWLIVLELAFRGIGLDNVLIMARLDDSGALLRSGKVLPLCQSLRNTFAASAAVLTAAAGKADAVNMIVGVTSSTAPLIFCVFRRSSWKTLSFSRQTVFNATVLKSVAAPTSQSKTCMLSRDETEGDDNVEPGVLLLTVPLSVDMFCQTSVY